MDHFSGAQKTGGGGSQGVRLAPPPLVRPTPSDLKGLHPLGTHRTGGKPVQLTNERADGRSQAVGEQEEVRVSVRKVRPPNRCTTFSLHTHAYTFARRINAVCEQVGSGSGSAISFRSFWSGFLHARIQSAWCLQNIISQTPWSRSRSAEYWRSSCTSEDST